MACLISTERDRTLQVELEGAQVIRNRLEEVLGRSLERLSRLETMAAIGGGELESVRVRHEHGFWALAGQTAARDGDPVCTNQRALSELNGDLLMIELVQVASPTKWNSLSLPVSLFLTVSKLNGGGYKVYLHTIISFHFSFLTTSLPSFPSSLLWANKVYSSPTFTVHFIYSVSYHKCMCVYFFCHSINSCSEWEQFFNQRFKMRERMRVCKNDSAEMV